MTATYVDEFTRPFTLSRRSTALLVIDMQYASGSRHHGLGGLLAGQGRLEEASYRFDRIERLLIPNIRRLLQAFRAHGARVIYVTLGPTAPDYSDAPAHLRGFFRATNNRAGTREHEIVDELRPEPGELVVNKTTMGAFGSSGIDAALKAAGIAEVVCTGVSTNNCVGMTAQEASDRGYGSVIVADATGTCSEAMQEAYHDTFRRLWGRVMSCEEVIAEIEARTPDRRPAAAAA